MESIGPYRIEREVARGGMGVVYRALDPQLGRPVALKVISAAEPAPEDLLRFEREGQALAALKHPNVMGVHGGGMAGRHPYLAVEWIEGESLQQRLQRAGPLTIDEALRIGETLALTLAYCHQAGVLHRDLKPQNVMVEGSSSGRLVVTDFGLAALRGADRRLTLSSEALGTPGYMAPEQTGGGEIGPAADVYGIGATLYALLTGRPPFEGGLLEVLGHLASRPPTSPRSLRAEIPVGLESVVLRCLAKGPAERFASA
ncbi:MAG: serine/threonine-protein kinase [Planctomycetota bacterium]